MKPVIFKYTSNAGGKFLINCLGLSDNAVFQSNNLTRTQLLWRLSQQDKIDYLHSQLTNITDKWNDLNLGWEPSIDNPDKISELLFSSEKYFFLVAHTDEVLDQKLKTWDNAVFVIVLYNAGAFRKFRRPTEHPDDEIEYTIEKWWNTTIRSKDWDFDCPSSLREFENLSTSIIDKINAHKITGLDLKLHCEVQEKLKKFKVIYWDTNWYFNADKTLQEIKKLYDVLNLTDFNEQEIKRYYWSWIETIKMLADK